MAQMFISIGPDGSVTFPQDWIEKVNKLGVRYTVMYTPDNLSEVDIYHTAKKLAELLLEQVSKIDG